MLRDYQQAIKDRIRGKWQELPPDRRRIMGVMPTGAGKTKTMACMMAESSHYTLAIAHRSELVGQISMALAREGVEHRIIAPPAVVNVIIGLHAERIGRSFYHPRADAAVAGIDTLVRREDDFFAKVGEFHGDEGHHFLEANKWGKGLGMLPEDAAGALWTATPLRSDRRSLRRGAGGCADELVLGPTMRQLINQGHLCDYRIFGLPEAIERARLQVTSGGEFNAGQLREEAHKSSITGDLVAHYLRLVPGKQCVVFAVDIALAYEHQAAYEAAGVRAAVVHGTMGTAERERLIRAFEARESQVLINVDILGEGFDCPGIEVVQMARPTASYGLYVQQFGRALRTLAGKQWGIILDHVGNVRAHGLPDRYRAWSLDAPQRRAREAPEIVLRYCSNVEACGLAYEGWEPRCPYCGHREPPPGPGAPRDLDRIDFVEGDLQEFTPEVLAMLRREAARISQAEAEVPYGASPGLRRSIQAKWDARRTAQARLQDAIAWWAGYMRDVEQQSDSASYRRFFLTYGLDVLSAQTLSARQAHELADKILSDLPKRESAA